MTPELQLLFQLVSTSSVLIGITFATYQFVQFRRQRRAEVALAIINNTWPAELVARTARRVWTLPDHASPEAIDALGPEVEQAVLVSCIAYENLGYLVFARIIPLRVFDDLLGGTARMTWRKVSAWVERTRTESGNANAFEWFQWLYERLEEHPAATATTPAHARHHRWRP